MKALILAVSAILMFCGYAVGREYIAGEHQQLSDAAVKTAMGPTSAPQKQGGMGEEPDSSKLHKKPKHKHQG